MQIQPKTNFKIPFPKDCLVIRVSIAIRIDRGNLRVFRYNIDCVKGQILYLREGDAEYGLVRAYETFLNPTWGKHFDLDLTHLAKKMRPYWLGPELSYAGYLGLPRAEFRALPGQGFNIACHEISKIRRSHRITLTRKDESLWIFLLEMLYFWSLRISRYCWRICILRKDSQVMWLLKTSTQGIIWWKMC